MMGNKEKEKEKDKVEKLIKEGDELFKQGDYKRALEKYAQGSELDKEMILYAINEMGNELYNQGKYQEAKECYDRTIEIDSEFKYGWNGKGNYLYNLKKYEEAIECYDRAIEIDSEFKYAWNNKGNSLDELRKYKEAIECYDRAIELDPKLTYAWNGKGNSLGNLGKYKEAIECYKRAIKIDPEYKRVWNGKGISLANLGKYKEAIESYDRAIELDPEDKGAWYNKGNSLAYLGKHKEAIECYDRAVELDHEFTWALNNKGESLYELKKYKEAFSYYNEALEFEGETKEKRIIRLNKAELLMVTSDYSGAIEEVAELIKEDPVSILKEVGIFVEGGENKKKVIKKSKGKPLLDEYHADGLMILGKICLFKKKFDKAIGYFEQANHIEPYKILPVMWSLFTRYLKLCTEEEKNKAKIGESGHDEEKKKESSAEGECRIHDLEETTSIIIELEKLKEVTDDPEYIAHISHWLGLLFYRTGDFFTSAQNFDRAIESFVRKKKFKYQKERVKFLLGDVWYCKLSPNIWTWWLSAPKALFRNLKRVIASLAIFIISIMLLGPFFPNLQLGDLSLPKEWTIIAVAISALLLILLLPFISKISFKGAEVELIPQAPEITLSPMALFTHVGMIKSKEPKKE